MLCGLYGDNVGDSGRTVEGQEVIRRVYLERRAGLSLGFTVRGGRELGTGLYVSGLDHGGHAELQGLRVGDRLLWVNEADFRRISHKRAVHIIRNTLRMIVCVTSAEAHRMPGSLPPGESRPAVSGECGSQRLIQVHAESDGYLGLSIRGGVDCPTPAFVSDLDTASPASRAGLKIGDVVLKLNGSDITSCTHMQIVRKATESEELTLLVNRPVHRPRNLTLTYHDSRRPRGVRRKTISNPQTQRAADENRIVRSHSNIGPHIDVKIPGNINECLSLNRPTQPRDTGNKVLKLISGTIRLNLKDQLEKVPNGQRTSYDAGVKVVQGNDINAPEVLPREIMPSINNNHPLTSGMYGADSRRHTELCHWNIPPSTAI